MPFDEWLKRCDCPARRGSGTHHTTAFVDLLLWNKAWKGLSVRVPNTVCCTTGEGLLIIFNEFISITEIQTIKLAVLHRMTVFW